MFYQWSFLRLITFLWQQFWWIGFLVLFTIAINSQIVCLGNSSWNEKRNSKYFVAKWNMSWPYICIYPSQFSSNAEYYVLISGVRLQWVLFHTRICCGKLFELQTRWTPSINARVICDTAAIFDATQTLKIMSGASFPVTGF